MFRPLTWAVIRSQVWAEEVTLFESQYKLIWVWNSTRFRCCFCIPIARRKWACSSVGIATELQAARSRVESPLGRDFPPFQTGSGDYLASCKMGTGFFPVVKCGRGVLLTTQLTNVLVDARANIKQQTWTVGPFQERSSINFGQIFDFSFSKETEVTEEEETYLE